MTDWDKLKEEKQRSISLCEARNGAILLLKDVRSDKWDSFVPRDCQKFIQIKQRAGQRASSRQRNNQKVI